MSFKQLAATCLLAATFASAAPALASTTCAESSASTTTTATSTSLPSPNHTSPSNNWAGGIHYDAGNVMKASVEIVVPPCGAGTPAYDYVPYSVSGWAGIDGDSACNEVVLQAGFYCDAMRINGTTNDTYIAWTEWFPAPGQNYDDFELAAGDVLKIDIVAHSKTAGFTRLHNKRTGQKKTTNYKDQTTPLCLGAAEWVIESELAFSAGGFITGERTAGYTPFEFKNAVWHGKDGHKYPAIEDDMFNMVQNGTEVAEAKFQRNGHFKVVDVTPADWNPGN